MKKNSAIRDLAVRNEFVVPRQGLRARSSRNGKKCDVSGVVPLPGLTGNLVMDNNPRGAHAGGG